MEKKKKKKWLCFWQFYLSRMWFHRTLRADDWILFVVNILLKGLSFSYFLSSFVKMLIFSVPQISSPSANNARGLVLGQMFNRKGEVNSALDVFVIQNKLVSFGILFSDPFSSLCLLSLSFNSRLHDACLCQDIEITTFRSDSSSSHWLKKASSEILGGQAQPPDQSCDEVYTLIFSVS